MAQTAYNFSSFDLRPEPTAFAPPQILESLIPGFSIVTSLFSAYLGIDVTRYIGTLIALVAIFTAFAYCKDAAFDTFSQYLISTAQVHFDDEVYNHLLLWISKQPRLAQQATHFVASTRVNSAMLDSDDSDKEGDSDDDCSDDGNDDRGRADLLSHGAAAVPAVADRLKALRYTPAYGTHYFRYHGRWLALTREREQKGNSQWGLLYAERVYVSCLGRDPAILKTLLREAQSGYAARDGNRTIIYRAVRDPYGGRDSMEWSRCLSRPPRPMATVVLDEAQKAGLLADMREYLRRRTRRWYSNRGIPYRRGYLLHGPPGTGKTSLCFAAAGLLRLRIYVVSLNSRALTEEGLAGLFKDLPWRCIVLLEDIDAAGLTAKRADVKPAEPAADAPADTSATTKAADALKGISLSGFLNIIDGVASAEGRILVMTTNHIERLDPALLRPGRVDRTVRFGPATRDVVAGLFRAIFGSIEDVPEPTTNGAPKAPGHGGATGEKEARPKLAAHRYHDKSDAEVTELAELFAERVPDSQFTPAEIQGFLLQHKHSPDAALAGIGLWMQERRAEKKVQETGV